MPIGLDNTIPSPPVGDAWKRREESDSGSKVGGVKNKIVRDANKKRKYTNEELANMSQDELDKIAGGELEEDESWRERSWDSHVDPYTDNPKPKEPPIPKSEEYYNFPKDPRLAFNLHANGHDGVILPFSGVSGTSSVKSMMPDYLGDKSPEIHAERKKMFEKMIRNKDFYGVTSLMNPYSLTRIYGSLDVDLRGEVTDNYLIDKLHRRKFYDIHTLTNDPTIISTPTTTNIIRFGASDEWGRIPYSYQDFVFCKHWNIIPNNRLITLRRYFEPTTDNLNFPDMMSGNEADQTKSFAPFVSMVSYFGGESENNLGSLLEFSTGYKWRQIQSDVWRVEPANSGSGLEAMALGRAGEGAGLLKKLATGALTVGNIGAGLFYQEDMTDGLNLDALLKHNMPDPYENGAWSNRIQGPVNSIDTVMARDKGLKFSMSGLRISFHYVARPIGNINPKAALLDILANALLMGTSSAMFFKGAHRFMVDPTLLPLNSHMDKFLRMIRNRDWQGVGEVFNKLVSSVGANAFRDLVDHIQNKTTAVASDAKDTVTRTADAFTGSESSSIDTRNSGAQTSATLIVDNIKGFLNRNVDTALVSKIISLALTNWAGIPYLQGKKALLQGDPVGEWHLTIGNPMNPIAVIGNLVCTDMSVKWSEELGNDDFPLEMTITYTLEHGMPRDSDAIASMFNKGAGRIYALPDWAKTSSDYVTKVDQYIKDRDDGMIVRDAYGFNEDTPNQLDMIYRMSSDQNHRRGERGAGEVRAEVRNVVNGGDATTLHVPKYTPLAPNETINFISDLDTRARYDIDVSKYADLVGHN